MSPSPRARPDIGPLLRALTTHGGELARLEGDVGAWLEQEGLDPPSVAGDVLALSVMLEASPAAVSEIFAVGWTAAREHLRRAGGST